jgi:transposase
MTRQILWSRYKTAHPDGYGLSQFKYYYHQWLKRSKPVMHMEHIAGDKMFICIHALDYYGGVPRAIVPDNL